MIRLVTFGQGGDSTHDDNGSTCSGYGNPDRPHAAEGKDIPDGTPVIDKRKAVDTPEGYSWVFKGPLVNVNLPDGEACYCPEPSPILAAGVSGSYVGLLGLQAASRATQATRGPLDEVSVSEYVRGWKEHGARIGEYQGGQIVWSE